MIKIPLIGFDREVFSMLILYIGYLSLGALIFVAVEADDGEYARNASQHAELIKSMVDVLRKEKFSDQQISDSFNQKTEQVSKSQNASWKNIFGEKFLFSMVLISTIGYGNVRPESSGGKYACIIYAIFGVPLHVTFTRLISFQFRAGLRKVVKKVEKMMNSVFLESLVIIIYFVFFSTIFVFVPSVIFSIFEDWSYLESVYYSFVTLNTIGFGDYVSSVGSREHIANYHFFHVMLMFTWLLLGVTFVGMGLNLLSYLLGLLILDKLDCRCYKRSAARKSMSSIYDCICELNWQLAKQRPQNFTKWKNLENFMQMCVENPQDVTKQTLKDVLDALDDLNDAVFKDPAMLDIPRKSRPRVFSRAKKRDSTPKPVTEPKPLSDLMTEGANVYKSAKDWKPRRITFLSPSTSKIYESKQDPDFNKNDGPISEAQSSLKSNEDLILSENSTGSPSR